MRGERGLHRTGTGWDSWQWCSFSVIRMDVRNLQSFHISRAHLFLLNVDCISLAFCQPTLKFLHCVRFRVDSMLSTSHRWTGVLVWLLSLPRETVLKGALVGMPAPITPRPA